MATSQASIAVSYKTILFATDFLESSEPALPFVLSIARFFDSTVIAAHAVPFEPFVGVAMLPTTGEGGFEWSNATDALKEYQRTHAFAGLRHEFVLEQGDPCFVIDDLVRRYHADLVVEGTHGRRGFQKLFGGSIAEQIFRTASCPVLTIGPKVARCTADWQPRHILFATEFLEGSLHALPHALAVAELNAAEITFLHSVPLAPHAQRDETGTVCQRRLEKLIPDEIPHHYHVKFQVSFDFPAPNILAAAERENTDLIVMGVHHTRVPKVEAHTVGTTACDVIREAHCPVLTVRA